jgi:hypothetical protein
VLSLRSVLGLTVVALLSACSTAAASHSSSSLASPRPSASQTSSSTSSPKASAIRITGTLTEAQRAVVTRLASGLPDPVEIDEVSFGTTPADVSPFAHVVGGSAGIWLSVSSPATGSIPSMRADFETGLLVAAVSRAFSDADLGTVSGGHLTLTNGPPNEAHGRNERQSGDSMLISTESVKRMYRDENNKPSALTIDHSTFTKAIEAAAATSGVTVTAIRFAGLLGTVVEVDQTAPGVDATQHTAFGDPRIDEGSLEGVFQVTRDPQGHLIVATYYLTGLQQGALLPGTAYSADFGDASQAPSPS